MSMISFPTVSYIIPVYNHEQYIVQTLDSILLDTYPNKEILIINDGSTDACHEKIQSWLKIHENDITVVYKSRENKGITRTLNELISMSSGQYIIPIASDDYLINDMTSHRIEVLKNNPEKLMLINDAIVVNENNDITFASGNFELYGGNKNNFFSEEGLISEIVRNWSCVGPICIMDKRIYDQIGYYDTDIPIEDWDFYLRASAKKLILFEDIKVSAYRIHNNNAHATLSNRVNMLKAIAQTAHQNRKNFDFPFNIILYFKYIKSNLSMIKLYVLSKYFNLL
ncbi:glycosyltransferase family 2 protein [Sulfuricurvum sp.]|uniref:glycosyltransferase family 2 protein n=1 Tax=Sulfuricurvum sp. TaxID=2025608 RepID=UPI003BB135A8